MNRFSTWDVLLQRLGRNPFLKSLATGDPKEEFATSLLHKKRTLQKRFVPFAGVLPRPLGLFVIG